MRRRQTPTRRARGRQTTRLAATVGFGVLGLLAAGTVSAEDPPANGTDPAVLEPKYEAKTFDLPGADFTLPYRIYTPKTEPGKTYPLLVFLHGAGERGADNRAQLKHGAVDFVGPLVQEGHPTFVVLPQVPTGRRWAEATWEGADAAPGTSATLAPPEDAKDPAAAVLALIAELRKSHPIDATRIYLTGISMGGYGTWDLLGREPNLFAAAVPICGGGLPGAAERFRAVPIWVFHGDADRAVPVSRSQEMVAALQKHGAKVRYKEYAGVGHDCWTETYRTPALYEWLFEQVNTRQVPPVAR